jgi:hypothetical protein
MSWSTCRGSSSSSQPSSPTSRPNTKARGARPATPTLARCGKLVGEPRPNPFAGPNLGDLRVVTQVAQVHAMSLFFTTGLVLYSYLADGIRITSRPFPAYESNALCSQARRGDFPFYSSLAQDCMDSKAPCSRLRLPCATLRLWGRHHTRAERFRRS